MNRRQERGALASAARFLRRNPLVLLGLAIFLMWVVISIGAPWIAPYDPLKQDIVARLQPPSPCRCWRRRRNRLSRKRARRIRISTPPSRNGAASAPEPDAARGNEASGEGRRH